MTARINEVLKELFAKMNINLIDFKIEFGRTSDGDRSGGRGVARYLPAVGYGYQREARQGSLPS